MNQENQNELLNANTIPNSTNGIENPGMSGMPETNIIDPSFTNQVNGQESNQQATMLNVEMGASVASGNPSGMNMEQMNQQVGMPSGMIATAENQNVVSNNPQFSMMENNGSSSIGDINPLTGGLEQSIPETENEGYEVSSDVDADLEKRNKAGMRFIIIFGLLVLIFIILLPFIDSLI